MITERRIRYGFLKCILLITESFLYAHNMPAIKTTAKKTVKTILPELNMMFANIPSDFGSEHVILQSDIR